MKRKTAAILALLLALSLAACARRAETPDAGAPDTARTETIGAQPRSESAPSHPVFTRENFPRLNGSTAMVPLGQAIASVLLGETREQVADLTNFSRTTQSYRELMWGQADLLISGAPPQSIYEEKEAQGFEWELSAFAVDGLVFVVNENNPVDSLTTEQIQKIYSGEITNWSEVGGDDVDIVPFQRNEEAGSQTAMRKLVMGDIPLMDAPAEYVSGAMGDLVKVVASYDDTAAAIGYTVYYYAHDMKMADGLKLLAVDGVAPSAQTIRSREYPFINDSYVVIAAGLSDDAPAKILYDWLLSEDGQRLVAHEGYVSVLDVGDGAWPELAPYESAREVYTHHAGWRADGRFVPRADYGALLPYVGKCAVMEQYVIDALPLYGLVTDKGELVTEPVYADIFFYDDDFLMLYRGDPENGVAGGDGYGGGRFCRTLAAADGRWAHELADSYYVESGCGLFLTAAADGSIDVWNADGEIVTHFDGAQFTPYFGEEFFWGGEGEPFLNLTDERIGYAVSYIVNGEYVEDGVRLYLDLVSGDVLTEPPAGYPAEIDYASLGEDVPVPPEVEACVYYDPITDAITGRTYFLVYRVGADGEQGHYALFDDAGAVLVENADMAPMETSTVVRAGLCSTLEDGCFCLRSLADNALVFRYALKTNSD